MNFLTQTGFPILLAVLTIAISLAAFYAYYSRSVLGALVRALLARSAFSPERAATFAELGLSPRRAFVRALRPNSSLSAVVRCADPSADAARKWGARAPRFDLATARFFIPESAVKKARSAYTKHVGGPLAPILVTLGAAALAAALYFLLPLVAEIPA